MSQTLVNLILFGNAGLWLVVFLLARKGAHTPRLRPLLSGFVLRKPWAGNACLSLVGFLSLLMPLVVATSDFRLYGTVRPDHQPFFWAFVGIGLAGATLLWWLGRPTELIVHEDRHIYRWIEGWPPFQWTRTGPLSDLSGVGAMMGGGNAYFAYVGGPGGAGRLVVERFSSAEGAEYYADELVAVLGVPRLEPGACRWPRLSRQRQRANAEAANARLTYRRCRRYILRSGPDKSPTGTYGLITNEYPVN